MKRYLLFIVAIITLSSCSTVEYVYDYYESSARLLEGSSNFIVSPTIADLEVSSNRIIHVEKDAFIDLTVTRAVIADIAAYKRLALSRAAKAHKADILVGAEIDVETIGRRLVITVTGYPATYQKFRTATDEDIKLVKDAQSIYHTRSVIVDAPQQVLDVNIVK